MEIHNLSKFNISRDTDDRFASSAVIPSREEVRIDAGDTAYGYVYDGKTTLSTKNFNQTIGSGMYFCVPGPASISNCYGFVAVKHQYVGVPLFGGPVERLGRLKYIDGCSDSLLISPLIKGDPCLNYLYIPPSINQTRHTHPSVRIGCILEGAGYCQVDGVKLDLLPGTAFVLRTDEPHSFHTSDKSLRIVIYHPDSDFGPTHEAHPMVNRTIVEGKSLAGDNIFRTKEIREFVK